MTITIPKLGEARRREEAARRRGERFRVDDDVRAARVAIMEKRDAVHDQRQAEVRAEQEARPDAILGVLQHASVAELGEFARRVGQVDPRRLVEITNDLIRQKSRTRYVVPVEPEEPVADTAQVAPELAQETPPASDASSAGRTRRRAS